VDGGVVPADAGLLRAARGSASYSALKPIAGPPSPFVYVAGVPLGGRIVFERVGPVADTLELQRASNDRVVR
jgi:hypothetical protein